MPFCTNCGAENAADAAFCEECGTAFLAGVAPPPAPAATGGFCPFRLCAPIAAVVLIAAAAGGVFAYRAMSDDDDGSSVVAEETSTPRPEKTAKPTLKPTARRTATRAPATKSPPTETPPSPPTEASPTEQPLPGFATPEDALADYVMNFLKEVYAGDCDTTNIETDVGKVCSRLVEDRGDSAVYAIGLTFSEFGEWVLLVKVDDLWQVGKTAPMNEAFEPPF